MKRLHTVALLLAAIVAVFATLTAALAAEDTASADKCTTEITLKYITACSVMRALGVSNKGVLAPDDATTSSQGLDTIVAAQSTNRLVITGSKSAVKSTEAAISQMDVEPQTVLVKLNYYEVDSKFGDMVDHINKAYSTSFGSSLPTSELVKGLERELRAVGDKPMITPLLSALTYTRTEVSNDFYIPSAQTGKPIVYSAKSAVTPRLNSDNTITLSVEASVSDMQRTHSICTQRRNSPGEPMLVGKFDSQPGKILILIANATLLPTSASFMEDVVAKTAELPLSPLPVAMYADCILVDAAGAAELLPGGFDTAADLTNHELSALWMKIGLCLFSRPLQSVPVGVKADILADTWIRDDKGMRQSKDVETRLSVLPTINQDGTITLDTTASLCDKSAGGATTSLGAVRKVSNGERILLGGYEYAPGKYALIFLNARIMNIKLVPAPNTSQP